jgi:hypothetical protein
MFETDIDKKGEYFSQNCSSSETERFWPHGTRLGAVAGRPFVFEKAARQATAILPFLTNIKLSQFMLFPVTVAVQPRQV